ncbi:choice-of-anchor P family protein [Parafrankia discariae]|uniref:choice-of-anchor P family protein n=1 Tax=Parafrankia discariae TaxID=365528 RepID=UPI000378E5B3|nr:choice-of-anchor P family protein [Parafrankia discariae]
MLSTGAIGAEAGPTTAHAAVAGLSVSLSTLAGVTVGAVDSSCAYDPATGNVTGKTVIADGELHLLGIPIPLQVGPVPNTTVALPAGLGTITLNQQSTAPDGTLTVDAVAINLLGGLENVVIARSVCIDAP